MQRDYPDIVTSVKTKQAVQIVLNTASESLQFMISGGIVDRNEGDELHKVIFKSLVLLWHVYPVLQVG